MSSLLIPPLRDMTSEPTASAFPYENTNFTPVHLIGYVKRVWYHIPSILFVFTLTGPSVSKKKPLVPEDVKEIF